MTSTEAESASISVQLPERDSGVRARVKVLVLPGLVALVLAAPLMIGGGPPWAQLMISALALVVLLLEFVSRAGRLRWAPWSSLLLFQAGVSALQVVPLPAALVGVLSPRALDLRHEVLDRPPSFLPLSVDVPATLFSLANSVTAIAAFTVALSVARRRSRVAILAATIVTLGTVLALIALVQRLSGAVFILGIYRPLETPGGGPFGTFVNGNHAASVLTLSILMGLGLASECAGWTRTAALAGSAITAVALFATGSRAGALSFMVAALLLCILLAKKRLGLWRAALLGLSSSAALTVLVLLFADTLKTRLFDAGLAALWDNQKVRGWWAAVRLTREFPWTGVGRGAFEAPATAHRTASEGVRLAHPENVVLQLLAEWGIPATLAFLGLLVWALSRSLKRPSHLSATGVAAACAVAGVTLHEMADFGLELPGVSVPFLVTLAILCGRDPQRRSPGRAQRNAIGPLGSGTLVTMGILSLGLAAWARPRLMRTESRDLYALQRSGAPDLLPRIDAAICRHPADYYLWMLAASERARRADPNAFANLGVAQRLYPANGWLHYTAGRWLARAGRGSQAALEFRLAAELGHDVTLDELLSSLPDRLVARAVPQTPDRLLALSHWMLERGQIRRAQEISGTATELAPTSEDVALRRLRQALRSKDQPFIADAARGAAETATTPESILQIAAAYRDARLLPDARLLLKKGLERFPSSTLLRLELASADLEQGEIDSAETALLKMRNQSGLSIEARGKVMRLLLRAGEARRAASGATQQAPSLTRP